MIQPLHEFVGLPQETDHSVLHGAFDERFNTLLERSSRGDRKANSELVSLRLAYLNWAYGRREPYDLCSASQG